MNTKIENVIDTCTKCRFMKKVQEVNGNTFYAAICEYGLHKGDIDKPHPFVVLATATNRDVFNSVINIPDNCPLETYSNDK